MVKPFLMNAQRDHSTRPSVCELCLEYVNAPTLLARIVFGFYTNALSVSCSHLQEAETGFVPSVQDFDRKLAEADAYLQILIDQLKVGFDTLYKEF